MLMHQKGAEVVQSDATRGPDVVIVSASQKGLYKINLRKTLTKQYLAKPMLAKIFHSLNKVPA